MQLSREHLSTAYQIMKTIRVFEDRVNSEIASGDIPGAVHLYAGQEASAAGICMLLDNRDQIASTHRGHGHCIAKGCDVPQMMAEIFGKENGLCASVPAAASSCRKQRSGALRRRIRGPPNP